MIERQITMSKEIESILKYTPYNSYEDLFWAVCRNKATIRLSNGACRQILQTKKPFLANFGMHFGFIPSVIITVAFAVLSKNYLLLLLLLAESVFSIVVYFLHNINIKTWYVAGIVVICDLFFFELPLPVLILALSWMFNSWIVSWWQKKVYIESIKILQYNEYAFEWAYHTHNLLIEDCYGNIYSKLRQIELETESYERLLKVIRIGTGADDVDSAIDLFSSFYLKKGKFIPKELYFHIQHHSKNEKCEKLIKILELGIGVAGVENVTNRLIDFYKSKGVNFPNDI